MRNHILLLLLATHHLIIAIAKNCTCPKEWPMKTFFVCGKELNHVYKNDHCDPERYYVSRGLSIPAVPRENCPEEAVHGECELLSARIQDCHTTECCDNMLRSRHCMGHKYSVAHELTYFGKTIEEITEAFKFAQNYCYATNRTKYKLTNTRIKDCEAEAKKLNRTSSCRRGK